MRGFSGLDTGLMSGGRIFEQIKKHVRDYPRINYFYFNGLLLNGNLKVLEDFCDKMIENNTKIKWAGQAMVREDMSRALLNKMAKAGCVWLGYGIESGSQRILDLMNKHFDIEKAVGILKDTREAGIDFQINIMFGFPGETRRDFEKTIEFLTKARPYITSILASQSFFTLEKETYIRKNPRIFGITGSEHHLFWKSDEGKNDYPERFRRYEEFCATALKLGLPETSGVLRVKPDKWFLLGQYYKYDHDSVKAVECFKRSLDLESNNELTRQLMDECLRSAGSYE